MKNWQSYLGILVVLTSFFQMDLAQAAKKAKAKSKAQVETKTKSNGPVIESLLGANSIEVASTKGKRNEAVGAKLVKGDQLETNASTSLRLVYGDGTQLMIGRSSGVEILGEKSAAQSTHLAHGEVRAIVKPETSGKKKIKYVVRTKTMTMGVRGTDFSVNTGADGQSTQMHTLDGQVDVAKDEQSVLSGKGLAVKRDQFVEATGGKISVPKTFDRDQFMNTLKQRQPDLPGLASLAPKSQEELEKLKGKLPGGGGALPSVPSVPSVPEIPKAPALPQVPNPFGH
ncbi:FecR family protein [Bdellovibrionota bacterium FG-1]